MEPKGGVNKKADRPSINKRYLNMNLPTIQENKDLQQAVSARELYQFLEPTERFSNWFDRQVQYGFEEGVDYLGCKFFNTLAKQELQDYLMSVDMAKEVSMIQRSEKGKQARQYFIECEKKLSKQVFQLPDFTNPAEAARAFADQYEQKQIAMQKLAIAEPKALVYDTIVERDTLLNATQVGSKIGLTAQKLNKLLSVANVYDKRIKRSKTFSSWFIEKGLGEMKQTASGYPQALFTTKGEAWIIEKLAGGQ